MKITTTLLVLFLIMPSAHAQENNPLTNKDPGLHSDGGPWRFYPAENPDQTPKVLLIGDSIMNGYRGKVAAGLQGKASVEVWLTPLHLKSEYLYADLKKVLTRGPYHVIHFNIGLHGWPKGRILADEYEPLLGAYVNIIREHARGAKLIWASTTQITEKGKPITLDPVNNKTIRDRNMIAAKVMKEYGIPVNDLYTLMSDKLQLARGDKFHWNSEGYQHMAKQVISSIDQAMTAACVIVCPDDASAVQKLAAKEIRRYVYLRTGELPSIAEGLSATGPVIEIALDALLSDQAYRMRTIDRGGSRVLRISGGSDVAVLYGAYHFIETLGVRFYLHGDVIPDEKVAFEIPSLDEVHEPLFALRGILPFHDFPEGPDWWTLEEWKAVVSQLPKMRMNFVGLHTYPKGALGPEPTVWIGLPEDCHPDGTVKVSDSTSWHNTQRYAAYGCYRPMKTGEFSFGAADIFPTDDYGPEINRPHDFPFPETPAQSNAMFARAGRMLNEVFRHANSLGIKTCVGTEGPLKIPQVVKERLEGLGLDPNDPAVVQRLYKGMFLRIKRTFPIDYYWLWGHEGEVGVPGFLADVQSMVEGAAAARAPFDLAICGWGWMADNFPVFDRALSKDISFSCINHSVGNAAVSPNFSRLKERDKWAIPWFEDDPAMITPQLWVGRLRKDAAQARTYGCTGLMGLLWRTRVLGPNLAALARAGWDQSAWDKSPESTSLSSNRSVQVIGGKVASYLNTPIAGTEDDQLYQQVRYDLDGYRFAVPDGSYTVTLKFCEPAYTQVNKRVFSVKLQGQRVIDQLDIFDRAGKNRALDRVFETVVVNDGQLSIDFIAQVEYPCIAAIAIKGNGVQRKINCGGSAFGEYVADVQSPKEPRYLPAGDFYRDWARHQFGAGVGAEAAAIFEKLDGHFPRPSHWNRGPGVIAINRKPWEEEKSKYQFVERFAALRPSVQGKGSLERFDWWLNQFRYTRAMAQLGCMRGELDGFIKQIDDPNVSKPKQETALTQALERRRQLVPLLGDMVGHLLGTLNNSSEMGTIANVEQQSMLRTQLLTKHDEKLEQRLDKPLLDDCQPWQDYRGPTRIVVPAKRTSLLLGESLRLKIILLGHNQVKQTKLYWRPLGKGKYRSVPLKHVARAVYAVTLPPARADLEYYIQAETKEGGTLNWPVTSPDLNQTVVVLAPSN